MVWVHQQVFPSHGRLPIAHSMYCVLCVYCTKFTSAQNTHCLLSKFLKVIAHYPLNIANCPLHPGNDWSPTAQNPFSFTTAGVNFFLQVWLRFSSSCCWEGSQTAASTPTSHPGTSYFLFEFFRFFLHIFPQAHNVHLPAEGLWGSEVDPWVEFVSILSEMYIM